MRHVLDQPDSGAVARLRVGDTLELRLLQNGGTGYVWALTHLPAALTLTDDELVPSRESTVGAAAVRVLLLDVGTGDGGALRLDLKRPWESTPARATEIEIVVDR